MRFAQRRRAVIHAAGIPQSLETSVSIAPAVGASAHFSLTQSWRDALQAYSAQPAIFLSFSIIGFAGASMMGMALSALAGGEWLDAYLHATGPFPTYSALGKIDVDPANYLFMCLLAQSLLGWVLAAFSSGAIAHAVLSRRGVIAACHAASKKMPALLWVALLNSFVIGSGAIGLNIGLRNINLDLSNAGQDVITEYGAFEKFTMYGIDQSLSVTGSPVAEFLPFFRNKLFRDWDIVLDYQANLAVAYNLPVQQPMSPHSDIDPYSRVRYVTIASLLIMLIAQTLLCFGAPAVISMRSVFSPILHSAGWGIRYFLPLVLSRSALFGLMAGVKIIFIVIPLVLVQCLIRPPTVAAGRVEHKCRDVHRDDNAHRRCPVLRICHCSCNRAFCTTDAKAGVNFERTCREK